MSASVAASSALLAVAVLVRPPHPARARVAPPARAAGGRDRIAGLALPLTCGASVGALVAVLVGGVAGLLGGAVLTVAVTVAARRWLAATAEPPPADPLVLAGAWDLFAACLRAGLPVATAIAAVADRVQGRDGALLRTVADLLAIGADPAQAWEPALASPATTALARAARRTARSGAAMATAVAELAADLRASAADRAEERAQRAGVLITGPLGLCFLPAFFCLGVLPVIAGLAGQLMRTW